MNWSYVYVVYRIGADIHKVASGGDPNLYVTMKEVFTSEEEADAEVSRLNNLNAPKGDRYFYQNARFYPAGR